jgi:uncharacterized protein (TIGR01777 family)
VSIPSGKVVIAGGSGFLGQALSASLLQDGYRVVILGRGNKSGLKGEFIKWDAKTMGSWSQQLEGALALFNLTGRSIDCRYTEKNKALILNSRVDSTQILGEAIKNCMEPPKVWLNASTATVYKDIRGDLQPHDENSETNAEGFAEDVGRAWEKVFFESSREGVRQVAMRISIVLGKGGGAFPVLRRLTRFGLGGRQGPGNQWMSWLHLDDWVGIAKFLMTNPAISGPVNLAAPNPVTNQEFMRCMRKEFAPLGIGFPAPTPAIYLGGLFMGTEPDLVLKSRKLKSAKLESTGYSFSYPSIEQALSALAG